MKLTKNNGIFVLEFEGEVVFENSNGLKNKAKKLLQEEKADKVIIDLSKVPLIDSSGVGVLISLYKNIREKEGKLVLAAPVEKVRKILTITSLQKIMPIFDSLEEAVESIQK